MHARFLALFPVAIRSQTEALPDEELARRARRDDPDAYALLVQRYQRGVVNLMYRLVGEWQTALDLAQEVFLRVYQTLDAYDDSRPFKPWLYRIATHRAYDYLRHQARRTRVITTVEASPDFSGDERHTNPQNAVIQGEIRQAVEDIVSSLPVRYRTVIVLRYLEDMSYREIAEALNIPLGTVKTRIHRARDLLRAALEEKDLVP